MKAREIAERLDRTLKHHGDSVDLFEAALVEYGNQKLEEAANEALCMCVTKQMKPFVMGMLKMARKMLNDCAWYEFNEKNRLKGYIKACYDVLGEL